MSNIRALGPSWIGRLDGGFKRGSGPKHGHMLPNTEASAVIEIMLRSI